MLRFYCDGCQRQMSGQQAVESRLAEVHAQGGQPGSNIVYADVTSPFEVFCPQCIEQAQSWWQQAKPALALELKKQAEGRIENVRKDHFRRSKVAPKTTTGSS